MEPRKIKYTSFWQKGCFMLALCNGKERLSWPWKVKQPLSCFISEPKGVLLQNPITFQMQGGLLEGIPAVISSDLP